MKIPWFEAPYEGRNHVNETTRHGIIAHRIWEENLGNLTRSSLTIPLGSLRGFVAQTLWEEFLQAK